jgi:hypothetical protein
MTARYTGRDYVATYNGVIYEHWKFSLAMGTNNAFYR